MRYMEYEGEALVCEECGALIRPEVTVFDQVPKMTLHLEWHKRLVRVTGQVHPDRMAR